MEIYDSSWNKILYKVVYEMTLIKLIKRILYPRVSPEKMRHREYQRVMQGEILKHLGKGK